MTRCIAIVGGGPAGFYAAEALLAHADVHVDIIDQWPTPFGLVRAGIAPDHQKTKRVVRAFERTAANPKFRYFGNICVGDTVSVEDLKAHYDAVLFAHGAMADKPLAIEGENLFGCLSATQFVGWYNGHPDYTDLVVDLTAEEAVVIGNGNVAADVCRILLTPPDLLASTDIAEHALRELRASRIRSVHMIGRKGPDACRFTSPELAELGHIPGVQIAFSEPSCLSVPTGEDLADNIRQNLSIFLSFSKRPAATDQKSLTFRFHLSPQRILGADDVSGVEFEDNRSGAITQLRCGLVVRSVGNQGRPLSGLPFDANTFTVCHVEGRIVENGCVLPGLYVAGWAKRGPSGTVGTNRIDSQETCRALLADMVTLPVRSAHPNELLARLRSAQTITDYGDWLQIDAAEIAAGLGRKPREKFVRVRDMHAVASESRAGRGGETA